jgi:hypothetical protein
LEALLRSIKENIAGIASTTIIYRVENEQFAAGYDLLQNQYPAHVWQQQGKFPEKDFKLLTMNALHSGQSAYVLFAVDDMIVKNKATLSQCTKLLEDTGAYGFYLRLGTHLDYCYASSSYQPLPALSFITPTVVAWTFGTTTGDWAYPNTVDMTIFRKTDLINELNQLQFRNPNTMEKEWAKQQGKVFQRIGLCFVDSVVMNIPLNIVQTEWYNRNLAKWSAAELLSIFQEGKRIDLRPLQGIKNHSCHTDCALEFTIQ